MKPFAAFDYFSHLATDGVVPPVLPETATVYCGPVGDHLTKANAERAWVVLCQWYDLNPVGFGFDRFDQGLVWAEGEVVRNGQRLAVRSPLFSRHVGMLENSTWAGSSRSFTVKSSQPWTIADGVFGQAETHELKRQLGHATTTLTMSDEVVQRAIELLAAEPRLVIRREYGLWRTKRGKARLQFFGLEGPGLGWHGLGPAGTAFGQLYGGDEKVEPHGDAAIRCPLPLNTEQRAVIDRAMREPLVVASGPPGTGKTHLLVGAALEQFGARRSTLIATDSLAAADSIEEMLARFPMVNAVRFDTHLEPALLGNELAEGVENDPQLAMDYTEQILADLDAKIAEVDTALRYRLIAASGPEGRDAGSGRPSVGASGSGTSGSGASGSGRRWFDRLRRRPQASSDVAPLSELENSATGQLWDELESLLAERTAAIGAVLEATRRHKMSGGARRSLGQLARALRLAPADRLRALDDHPEKFLQAAPLWFGTLDALDSFLPSRRALFDLVIFDEASQVSQLRAAPALLRARRALVVGDPRQMRHEPLATQERHEAAGRAARLSADDLDQLNEPTVSLFDMAAQAAAVSRLREHFRSSPHIIGFSNERFYRDELRLMTQHPGRESRDAIHDITVARGAVKDGVSTGEVRAVIRQIEQLIELGYLSIGVVAGFELQAEAIQRAVVATFGTAEIKRLRLRVGTPREFQGIERDAIIVSPGLHDGNLDVLRALEDPTVFNVVVTRAKRDVWVVMTMPPEDLPPGLLRDYLGYSHTPPAPLSAPSLRTAGAGWKAQVAAGLVGLDDVQVVVDYAVGEHTVDLAIGTGLTAFGVETNVHPDGPDAHIDRHLALRRAGWTLVDAFESDWPGAGEACVAWLAARWARTP